MNRIAVIGCPGSTKSTFARGLCDKTGLALYYLDMTWHKSDKTNISREEFDAEFKQWIVDFPQKCLPEIYDLPKQHENENKNAIIFKTNRR